MHQSNSLTPGQSPPARLAQVSGLARSGSCAACNPCGTRCCRWQAASHKGTSTALATVAESNGSRGGGEKWRCCRPPPPLACHACALSCALVRLEHFGRKSEMCRRRGRGGFAFEASETRELTVSLTRVLLVMAVMEVISTPYTCRPATHPVTGALGRETTSSKVPSVPQTASTSTHPPTQTLCYPERTCKHGRPWACPPSHLQGPVLGDCRPARR